MMKSQLRKILVLSAYFLSIITSGFAAKDVKGPGKKSGAKKPSSELAANCSPATSATELNINNVRALIQNGGDMWWDFSTSQYEVPAGSGRTSLFAGSLWLGGQDVAGQLKVAALRFRDGNDFWPGPLNKDNGEVSPETCREYDRHFVTTRDEVAEFVAWQNADEATRQSLYPNYSIPRSFYEWPGNGRSMAPYYEDDFLAPFVDVNHDTWYNPDDGDYPAYDLTGEADCSQKIVNIYGDQNLWWIFNDKGNVHTETGSPAIGMEIRAQAFAFATNDEVNNMTFYNYELINRSTFTLTETYFGVWVDSDLGGPNDDYVGCDVMRGLGYSFNANEIDVTDGQLGYGENPPAVGVDFFQGPFQDADGVDNQVGINEGEALNGVGYGDGVIDNERFGMRRFLYHNNSGVNQAITDPESGTDYYNYLRGIWLDGSDMTYRGDGHDPTNEAAVKAHFMFPGDSDPLGWGTGGDPQPDWTETTADNPPGDRRFAQSAGPFTLEPGAVNNLTIGVVWARATSGGPWASVQALRRADDKTQALFDHCFKLIDGPDAPEVVVQELDQEVILMLSNITTSNNYREEYEGLDPLQESPDSVDVDGDGINDVKLTEEEKAEYATYRFEGYQIFQLKDGTVSADELDQPDRARLVAQVDIENDISQLVNYNFDPDLNASVPAEKVFGNNEGIRHSFQVKNDLFALGDNRLVNHKTYYFMAIAYSQNRFGGDFGNLAYLPDLYNENDPASLNGQKKPYLASRKGATGPIRVIRVIPHIPQPEAGGTDQLAEYGAGVEITRIEGQGNGGQVLRLTEESVVTLFDGESNLIPQPTYEAGFGPVDIKVVDPLNVKPGTYSLRLINPDSTFSLDEAIWELSGGALGNAVITSTQSVLVANEQLVQELGISITVEQADHPAELSMVTTGLLDATIEFEDPQNQWLTGVPDLEGNDFQNWIRSGVSFEEDDQDTPDNESQWGDYHRQTTIDSTLFRLFYDEGESFENVLGGTWAPLRLTSFLNHGPAPMQLYTEDIFQLLENLESVDIVFTADKSKWSRCPVLEMHDFDTAFTGGIPKGFMRDARSVDKDGNPGSAGDLAPSDDPQSPNYISAFGMGWFPGYVVNVETGERLNIAFGEDSWLHAENGADMKWNPTSTISEGIFGDVRWGGKHYIYIFRHNTSEDDRFPTPADRMPAYDAGQFIADNLQSANLPKLKTGYPRDEFRKVFQAVTWVGIPLLAQNAKLLSTDATVHLRVNKPFRGYSNGQSIELGDNLVEGETYLVANGPVIHNSATYEQGSHFVATADRFSSSNTGANVLETVNEGNPLYQFSLDKLAVEVLDNEEAVDALDLIRVVPNPYYAYSAYERNKLDNRVKITNLPVACTITVYTVNGTLVRTLKKNDPSITSMDWDLKNFARIPIASGTYIIHVDAPGIGEKVLKWFGVLRPTDLDAF